MKKILVIIIFFFSTSLYGQEIKLNLIKDYGLFNSTGNLHAIIYFMPFYILTRYPYNIDDVKRSYYTKIEIRSQEREMYNFLEKIENTTYTTAKMPNSPNLRCVVEFFYNNTLFFTYSLSGTDIIIDNKIINNENEFFDFVMLYLPKKYSYLEKN